MQTTIKPLKLIKSTSKSKLKLSPDNKNDITSLIKNSKTTKHYSITDNQSEDSTFLNITSNKTNLPSMNTTKKNIQLFKINEQMKLKMKTIKPKHNIPNNLLQIEKTTKDVKVAPETYARSRNTETNKINRYFSSEGQKKSNLQVNLQQTLNTMLTKLDRITSVSKDKNHKNPIIETLDNSRYSNQSIPINKSKIDISIKKKLKVPKQKTINPPIETQKHTYNNTKASISLPQSQNMNNQEQKEQKLSKSQNHFYSSSKEIESKLPNVITTTINNAKARHEFASFISKYFLAF